MFTPAGFERHFARMAAEREGVDPPDWALGPIPDVTVLGGPIDRDRAAGGTSDRRLSQGPDGLHPGCYRSPCG